MVHRVNLHDSPDIFLELTQAAAQHYSIPQVYVEKDYWVTKALKRLSESDYSDRMVFKGGTALSKAHKIIHRFSEDIDLAAKCCGVSANKTKTLLKRTEKAITVDLEYQEKHERESKHGRFRKTVYLYPRTVDAGDYGSVADVLVLEINAFSVPEPSQLLPISTLVESFLADQSRDDLISDYGLSPFEIEVLNVERTLCEKIVGLIRASHEDDADAALRRQIRHVYDLCMILRDAKYKTFLESDQFKSLIDAVRSTDRSLFEEAKQWLDKPVSEASIFSDAPKAWPSLSTEYRGSFREMLYSDADIPDDSEIVESLSAIYVQLQ